MNNLDSFDKKILTAVQKDAKLTAEQLGDACGLSPTAALKRYKKLKTDGVIKAEVAVVSAKAVGLAIQVAALVTLERERRDIIESFKKSIRNTPQIVQGYYITGEADFLIIIAAESMVEYEEFTQEFFYDKHRIKSFKTLVVLDAIKTGTALPIY